MMPTGAKRRPEDGGPAELHIVLLDNGRSAMLGSPVPGQALACIRCGACLNACPVYRQIGGHAYGSVYPGPIGAVLTPQLFGLGRSSELPYASSLCGACRDVCPVKIDIPALLLHLRAEVVATRAGKPRLLERLAFSAYAAVMARPRLFESVVRLARMLRVMLPLGAWTKWRDLRPLAPRSFREEWRTPRWSSDSCQRWETASCGSASRASRATACSRATPASPPRSGGSPRPARSCSSPRGRRTGCCRSSHRSTWRCFPARASATRWATRSPA